MSEETNSEVTGETEDAAVVVSRSVSHPVKSVWTVLLTKEGAEALLGPGAHLGEKGHTWTSDDGRSGVIRSYHPMEQLRFSWRASDDVPPSLVELNLIPQDQEHSRIEVKHTLREGLRPEDARDHWESALARIDEDCL